MNEVLSINMINSVILRIENQKYSEVNYLLETDELFYGFIVI